MAMVDIKRTRQVLLHSMVLAFVAGSFVALAAMATPAQAEEESEECLQVKIALIDGDIDSLRHDREQVVEEINDTNQTIESKLSLIKAIQRSNGEGFEPGALDDATEALRDAQAQLPELEAKKKQVEDKIVKLTLDREDLKKKKLVAGVSKGVKEFCRKISKFMGMPEPGTTGSGGGPKKDTGTSTTTPAPDTTNTGGLTPVVADSGSAESRSWWVIWSDGKNSFIAAYYPDGSSAWVYKPDGVQDYPMQNPPPMPKYVGKTELKFKTATTTTEEQPGKSSTGGSKAKETSKQTKTSSGKSKGKTAEKTDTKKGKKATAGKVLGTGLSVGLGVAGALRHNDRHKMMDDR